MTPIIALLCLFPVSMSLPTPVSPPPVTAPILTSPVTEKPPTIYNPFIPSDQLARRPQKVTNDLEYLHYPSRAVIFEPLPNIEVSRSSFTITSFVQLKPIFEQYDQFSKYLTDTYDHLFSGRILATLRANLPVPGYVATPPALRTQYSILSADESGPASRNSNPWCTDRFTKYSNQQVPKAIQWADDLSEEQCKTFCLNEPTCMYYQIDPNRKCSMGYRNHESAFDLTSNRHQGCQWLHFLF